MSLLRGRALTPTFTRGFASVVDPAPAFDLSKTPRQLTWTIERTASKQLPVYNQYKHRGYRINTIVRRFQGDVQALAEELETVCQATEMRIRPGSIELKGNHTRTIKLWFEKLGF